MVLFEAPEPRLGVAGGDRLDGRVVQTLGDAGSPLGGDDVEAVQPFALDRRDADRHAVAFGEEDAAGNRAPALADRLVGVRVVLGRKDVRDALERRSPLDREQRLRLVRPGVADRQRRRCSSIASRTIVGKS